MANTPGAYLNSDMDEIMVMKFCGSIAELMSLISPKVYQKYVMMENGKTVLCVRLRKSLYGCLGSAILFNKYLLVDLAKLGFTINAYNS